MRQSVATAVFLFSMTMLAPGCALEQADDPAPAPLAQQGAIDGSVRVSPTSDAGTSRGDSGGGPVAPTTTRGLLSHRGRRERR